MVEKKTHNHHHKVDGSIHSNNNNDRKLSTGCGNCDRVPILQLCSWTSICALSRDALSHASCSPRGLRQFCLGK